jgi:hypothetical protein
VFQRGRYVTSFFPYGIFPFTYLLRLSFFWKRVKLLFTPFPLESRTTADVNILRKPDTHLNFLIHRPHSYEFVELYTPIDQQRRKTNVTYFSHNQPSLAMHYLLYDISLMIKDGRQFGTLLHIPEDNL